MTVIRPNSISGINSITANGGDINLFRADGTKADIPIVNNITAGVVTATTFKGAIDATTGTFSGNLGVGGVLTYEDVTNIDSVGVITARSTVSIADSIVHTGDTNTSLRFPAADTITAETGGLERLRIDNDGRLLIGTTTEGHAAGDNLTVADSSNAGITIRSGTSNNGVIYFSDGTSGSAEYKGAVQYNHTDNYLRFYTNGAEKLRIDSGGNVTTPNNPAFAAKGVGGSWVTVAGSGDGVYSLGNTAHSGSNYYTNLNWASNNQSGGTDNRGSHWNNTTARFTAPVAGYYYFDINLYVKYSGQKTLHTMPYVGNTFTGTYDSSINTVVGGSSAYVQYPRTNRSITVYLTANNTFEWKVYSQTSIDVYPNYCWISGYLIG